MQADVSYDDLQPAATDKSPVDALAGKIADDKVLPIVGICFTNDLTFVSHDKLVSGWASWAKYPEVADKTSLNIARIAQSASYSGTGETVHDEVSVKKSYLNFLKAILLRLARNNDQVSKQSLAAMEAQQKTLSVSELAERFDFPSLNDPESNPLLLLASLPLSIYITTSFHKQLEAAIKQTRGVEAVTEICRWHPALHGLPSAFDNADYDPKKQPLVYHLHGCDEWPESMVLTVDDHLDFLAAISRDASAVQSQGRPAIHPCIKDALTLRSLAMVGYRPNDWDFRVLFRGLIKHYPQAMKLPRVAIQLEQDESTKTYLQHYLRQADFDVIEQEPADFIRELYNGWKDN
ncbi:MAG: SIR2 family protein [Chloroflexi bacterium]|nr:SIR2 family protein [Chloroflexota bacterium]